MPCSQALDVIVVNYNAGMLLQRCVESVLASEGVDVHCIVVDNASTDDSLQALDADQRIERRLMLVSNPDNRGFATAVNQGAALGQGDWLLLLNPDAVVEPDGLAALMHTARLLPEAGVLGPLIVNPDGTEQRGCRRDLPKPLDAFWQALKLHRIFPSSDFNHERRPLPVATVAVPAVSGACMLVRRAAFEQVGGFDEGFFLHFEDLDFCARLGEAGWGVYFVPTVRVEHVQGACSQGKEARISEYKAAGMKRYFSRHPAGQHVLLPLLKFLLRFR